MPRRVNASALPTVVAVLLFVTGCGGTRGAGGGSRVEIEWLEPPASESAPDAPRQPMVAPGPELGDGTAASEIVAGARRLLGLEVTPDVFVRHVLAGSLVEPAAFARAPLPAVGDLARGGDVVAVVERVDASGPGARLVLVGLQGGGRVARWTTPARGLAFERAAAPR
ncbi:MAG: hypothetical protein IT385_01115 [Deltaproteobacteria bacterium]|nr:hypothetical protein [Deltaproteobacteria bacterium]